MSHSHHANTDSSNAPPAVPPDGAPWAVHCPDWQQALLDLPASATPAQRDAVVADWAQRCWHDLGTALPQQRHVVLAHPGQVQERARFYLVTPEASGWLHSPLHATPTAPRWQAGSADLLLQQARQAIAAGCCGTEAGLHAAAAVWAALDAQTQRPAGLAQPHIPARPPAADVADTAASVSASASSAPAEPDAPIGPLWQRRYFPLLGTLRARAFAPMPAAMRQAGHAWGLYAVMGDADWTIRCMQLGVQLLQLRIKQAPADVIDAQIIRCAQAAHEQGALLIINDHWQAALRLAQRLPGIYGVHLGQDDAAALSEAALDELQASGLRLGVSSQTPWQLARALRLRPSYIACGPVHATTTKAIARPPVGLAGVRRWAQVLHGSLPEADAPALPLVAIGGMNAERAQAAAAAGADSVAVVSHITQAADPAQAIEALRRAVAQGLEQRQAEPETGMGS
ncbi:MAG: thiamine phosphate synthase [Brachymonas sp.]|nr:thiamine phosphate synthase [Brachymonas sp.]